MSTTLEDDRLRHFKFELPYSDQGIRGRSHFANDGGVGTLGSVMSASYAS